MLHGAVAYWRNLPANLRGIFCVVCGMIIFTAQDVLIKLLSATYPLHEIIVVRSSLAVAITVGVAATTVGLHVLRTRRYGWHIFRALLLVTMNLCYFAALASLPIADTVGIFFVAPLLISLLSVPVLGERLGPRRVVAVLFGLGGMLLILKPGAQVFQPVALLPLVSAVCYACMQLATRYIGRTESALSMSMYAQLAFLLISIVFGLLTGDGRYAGSGHPSLEFVLRAWTWPSLQAWLWMALCGLSVAIGAMLLSEAYRIAAAATLSPFEYVALPINVLWGFLVFGHLPDQWSFLGIAIIGVSGLYVFFREQARARENARA
jgi:drug/metabolite transporter (DMT)-like permease